AEQLHISPDSIFVNLNADLLKMSFDLGRRHLRGQLQTEVDNRLPVHTLIVEQSGEISREGLLAGFTPEPTVFDSDLLEAILGDEDGEDSICPVAVLPNRGFAAVRTGPRVSDPLALKPTKPVLRRTNYRYFPTDVIS
ncbi:hypothetical protein, partial [Halorubrum trueperi]